MEGEKNILLSPIPTIIALRLKKFTLKKIRKHNIVRTLKGKGRKSIKVTMFIEW